MNIRVLRGLTLFALVLGFSQVSRDAFAKGRAAIQGSISVKDKAKSEYSALAKISIQDAVSAATKTTSGKVTEAALDREDGFLVYEVEVQMPDQTRKELLIDAGNGKVLFTKEKNAKKSKEDDEEDDD